MLDVGAGTGRVALDARRARATTVCALDREPELLAALRERAPRRAGSRWTTVVADAGGFALARRFGLIIVPMQTIQLLPERRRLPRRRPAPPRARRAAGRRDRRPAGALRRRATGSCPRPTCGEVDGWRFESQPTAVRVGDRGADRIERMRRAVPPGRGAAEERDDAIELAHVDVAGLEAEGRAAGLAPEPARTIAADARARRLRGGAAPWLTGRCACARSIPT